MSPTPACTQIMKSKSATLTQVQKNIRKTLFRCAKCLKVYKNCRQTLKCLKNHGLYICKVCFEVISIVERDSHNIQKRHLDLGLWNCSFCEEKFNCEKRLKCHIGETHLWKVVRYNSNSTSAACMCCCSNMTDDNNALKDVEIASVTCLVSPENSKKEKEHLTLNFETKLIDDNKEAREKSSPNLQNNIISEQENKKNLEQVQICKESITNHSQDILETLFPVEEPFQETRNSVNSELPDFTLKHNISSEKESQIILNSQKLDTKKSNMKDRRKKVIYTLETQESVVKELRLQLRPYFTQQLINKEEYKNILRKAVPQISKVAKVKPQQIKELVKIYLEENRVLPNSKMLNFKEYTEAPKSKVENSASKNPQGGIWLYVPFSSFQNDTSTTQ